MIQSYLKIACRNLVNNKTISFVKIGSLAIANTCVILALLYWHYERNFDSFHDPSIYRVNSELIENLGDSKKMKGGTGQVQGPIFSREIQEIESFVRVLGGDIKIEVRSEKGSFKMNTMFVDTNFFSFFNFPLLHGSASTALKEVNSVVISQDAAMKLYGSTDVIGKLVYLDSEPSARRLGNKPLLIGAVAAKLPSNSSIQFDVLHPMNFLQLSFEDTNWLNSYLGTFVKIGEQANLQNVENKMNRIYEKNAAVQLENAIFDPQVSYKLQPFHEVHLQSFIEEGDLREGGLVNENTQFHSNLFLFIALSILLIAVSNLLSLHLSDTFEKRKVNSIHRIIGAENHHLFFNHFGEIIFITFLGLSLAFFISYLVLPFFNSIANSQIDFENLLHTKSLVLLLGLNLLITLLMNFHRFRISKNDQVTEMLKGNLSRVKGLSFQKFMVVFQFSIATVFMISIVVFHNQLKFIFNKDLGYEPNLILKTEISGNRDYALVKQILKSEIPKYPNFENISFVNKVGNNVYPTKISGQEQKVMYKAVDESYLDVMGIRLIKGENLKQLQNQDILVNEAFVKQFALIDPIGTPVILDSNKVDRTETFVIAGVVADYHYQSFHAPINPMVLYRSDNRADIILLKIKQNNTSQSIKEFGQLYQKAMPNAAFEYSFLTENMAKDYKQELQWQKIFFIATSLALFICSLGIFGLSHLSTKQRMKEIGIRKVVGASTESILALLSKDFLKLVLLGFLAGTPFAIYLVKIGIEQYAYRISLQWWMLAIAFITIFFIAFFTILFETSKAALMNPVKSLKTE